MFRLLRYFSFISFVAFIVVAILLGTFYRQNAVDDLIALEGRSNVALAQAFANSLWPQFSAYVNSTPGQSGEELRARPETAALQKAVMAQMDGLSVIKVKVYDLEGVVRFSTDTSQIGDDKGSNEGFLSARDGNVASELTHRDTFSAFEDMLEDRDVISSYIPIQPGGPTEPIEAVFELYSDVTPLIERIETAQKEVMAKVTLVLASLYILLYIIVRNADGIIAKQYRERQRAEEELTEHRHHLEALVKERTATLKTTNEQLAQEIIEHKQAEEEILRRTEEVAALNQIGRKLSRLGQTDEIVELIYTTIGRVLDNDNFFIALYEPAAQELFFPVYTIDGRRQEPQRYPFGNGVTEWVIGTGAPLLIPDNVLETITDLGIEAIDRPSHSLLAVPMLVGDRAIGVIAVQDYDRANVYNETHLDLLTTFAAQASIALENARLFSEVQQQANHLATLHEVDMAISTRLEPAELYETIVERASDLLHCAIANLFLWDSKAQEYVGLASYGANGESMRGERFAKHSSAIMPELLARPQPVAIRDAAQDNRVLPAWRQRFGARALLVVPLLYRESVSGFLTLLDTSGPRRWTQVEIELAESLAAQTSIALENARLHAETNSLLRQTRERTQQVRRIMDTVSDGVMLLNADHNVVLANPVAREYLSVLTDQSLDSPLTHLDGRPIEKLLAPPAKGMQHHEVVVNKAAQSVFEVMAQSMEFGPQSGSWVLVLRDVTEQRERQEYLQAQERLATVGQLAAGIAHDFNNIMAVIVLYSQMLLRETKLHEKAQGRLSTIYEQALRASELIGQILDFSRRSVMERRPADLLSFLKELLRLLERTLPESIVIELAYDEADYIVHADLTRLQQAIMNLALNARDAMPRGGTLNLTLGRLCLEPDQTRPLPDISPGNWIKLTVADTGIGIPSDLMHHIYEPFFTTKDHGQGTGLGLAQVYGIVKQHDGFINVSSQVEQGTTFTLYLPAAELSDTVTVNLGENLFVKGGHETILLVEDDVTTGAAVCDALEMADYEVILATNGHEALSVFDQRAEEISLVISDLVMPGMGGAALFQALRKRDPAIKAIMISGYPLMEEGKALVEEGVVAWIQKPFSVEKIVATVHEALGD